MSFSKIGDQNGDREIAGGSPWEPRWHWRKETSFDKNRVGLNVRRQKGLLPLGARGLTSERRPLWKAPASSPHHEQGPCVLFSSRTHCPLWSGLSWPVTLSIFLSCLASSLPPGNLVLTTSFPFKSPTFVLPQIFFFLPCWNLSCFSDLLTQYLCLR